MNISRFYRPAASATSSIPNNFFRSVHSAGQIPRNHYTSHPFNTSFTSPSSTLSNPYVTPCSVQRPSASPPNLTPSTQSMSASASTRSGPHIIRPGDPANDPPFSRPVGPSWASEEGWQPRGKPMSRPEELDKQTFLNSLFNTNIPPPVGEPEVPTPASMATPRQSHGGASSTFTQAPTTMSAQPTSTGSALRGMSGPKPTNLTSRLLQLRGQQAPQPSTCNSFTASSPLTRGTTLPLDFARTIGMNGIGRVVQVPSSGDEEGRSIGSIWKQPAPAFEPPPSLWEPRETIKDMWTQWLESHRDLADRQTKDAKIVAQQEMDKWKRSARKRDDAWLDVAETFGGTAEVIANTRDPVLSQALREMKESLMGLKRTMDSERATTIRIVRSMEHQFESLTKGSEFGDLLGDTLSKGIDFDKARNVWEGATKLSRVSRSGEREASPWDRFMSNYEVNGSRSQHPHFPPSNGHPLCLQGLSPIRSVPGSHLPFGNSSQHTPFPFGSFRDNFQQQFPSLGGFPQRQQPYFGDSLGSLGQTFQQPSSSGGFPRNESSFGSFSQSPRYSSMPQFSQRWQ
ncbi:hypothetical protein C351_01363 [Cryptococcus neoformans c8]|nr:hypothetical protein C353_01525 [Cryptococcus neoformans var. grubii AD1-83a]OXG65332.1 hypothetical protein C354_01538 [Cryptococcus neoformans var. grubii MW-RSA1955]OXG67199.1 hypothetical protein C351_01363 [Cryptococcus neoformans var. grubii c8]OXG70368.1 hypothetical protein C352_01540 [Cryptococcus neoformans var. grubii CHC193]OXH15931.1 hypothetical protein C369_01510 [Cryptococcus neoformans var. grubii A5-35-17]OXH17611.1 hypothetical protein C370_01516 [Cryptococcus neoformans 